jgi:dihydrofolate reductase
MGWAHRSLDNAEWSGFVRENAKAGDTLLLGRRTYDLMVSYGPTPGAIKADPVMAERMNNLPKVGFSRTLGEYEGMKTSASAKACRTSPLRNWHRRC